MTLEPPKPCEVERDDIWYRGDLIAWRRRDDGWWAHVRYTVAPGEQYLHVVPAARVRQLQR